MKTLRIGSGAGYGGDRIEPAVDLIHRGNLSYLIFECLAERTIALARPSQTALPAVDAFTECAVAWVQAHPPRRNEDGATNPSEENQP